MKRSPSGIWGDVLKYFLYLLLAGIIAWGISSCSPAKKVSNQVTDISALEKQFEERKQEILAKGIAEFIKNNPCTVPDLNVDSLCRTFYENAQNGFADGFYNSYDNPNEFHKDSIKPTPTIPKCKPNNVLRTVEDTRRVKLMEDSLQAARSRLAECQGNIAGRQQTIKEIKTVITPGKWKFNNWSWLAIAFLVLYVIRCLIFKRL